MLDIINVAFYPLILIDEYNNTTVDHCGSVVLFVCNLLKYHVCILIVPAIHLFLLYCQTKVGKYWFLGCDANFLSDSKSREVFPVPFIN